MSSNWGTTEQNHRSLGLVAVVGLHALIAAAWLADRPVEPVERAGVTRIQWMWLMPAAVPFAPHRQQQTKPAIEPSGKPREARSAAMSALPRSHAPAQVQAAPSSASNPGPDLARNDAVESQSPATEATPSGQSSVQASDLLNDARQLAGGIDRQLRRESGEPLSAKADNPHARFIAQLEAATTRKWTGVAKVTETTMPGTGERLYKISNGTDTYCIRIPSPSVGIDRYEWERNNFHPITCPR